MSTKTMTSNSLVSSSRKERYLHKLKLIGLLPQPQTYHLKKTKEAEAEAEQRDDDEVDAHVAVRCPPGGSEGVILYTTSLRSIRKTFEACQSVRFLLQSFKVAFQERDVAMDLGFRDELWKVVGGGMRVIPPRLFVKGRYVGGAEEVITLHEQGKLRRLFDGIPGGGDCVCCYGCGNLRFVVCTSCNGRRKVVVVAGGGGDQGGESGGFVRCLECNENGLMKCRICS